MDNFQEGWGLKRVKSLEKWDKRVSVIESFPMYRGMKKGQPIRVRLGLNFIDAMGFSSMVHMRMA